MWVRLPPSPLGCRDRRAAEGHGHPDRTMPTPAPWVDPNDHRSRLSPAGEAQGRRRSMSTTAATASATDRRVSHFSVAERAARGKAARAEVPRRVHGEWAPAPGRRDPVELLEEQAASRVPELVPIRYGRMLVSPFTFYRGAAYLMAADLAGAPRTGPARAAVRRRAPVELRRLRRARPAAGVRRQRLRRDAAGPVRVGPQAAGRELRGRRARPRLRRQDSGAAVNLAVDARVSRGDARASRRCGRSISGTRASTSTTLIAQFESQRRARSSRKLMEKNLAKARAKDSLRAFDKLTDDGRRRAADHQRPAADRADRGPRRRRERGDRGRSRAA